MDYKKHSHSVYLCTYHAVFVTKYRVKCISDEIGDFMKEHAAYLVGLKGGTLLSAETDADHVHMLMELPPHVSPADMIKVVKTQLSKECHQRYGEHLSHYLHGNAPLWSPSYFVATTGGAVMEKVRDYINSQRTDGHKRKYVLSGKFKKQRRSRS